MKMLLSVRLVATFGLVAASFAGAETSPPRIVESAGLPSLRLDNVRFDARNGEVRGTARVNFGYAAPRSSHVQVEVMNAMGTVIATGCDNLSLQSLAGHPRLPGYRTRGDAFAIKLKGDLSGMRSVRVVAEGGHQEQCNPEGNRFWNWFKASKSKSVKKSEGF